MDCKLKLFVSGVTKNSLAAIRNLSSLCETFPQGLSLLEIIDIQATPEEAEDLNVMVTPTLIIFDQLGNEALRLMGDLSGRSVLLSFLEDTLKLRETGKETFVPFPNIN